MSPSPLKITPQDVKRALTSREFKPQADKANGLIRRCWSLVESHGACDPGVHRLMAEFETDLVLAMLGKRHSEVKISDCQEAAACRLMDKLEAAKHVRLCSEWDAFKEDRTDDPKETTKADTSPSVC